MTAYDVVIVGGGMVGAALACALGESALKVAVVEAHEPNLAWPRPDYDLRVSAVSYASEQILRACGAWEGITQRRLAPYREMRVWDAEGNGAIHFDAADIGAATLGHIIENSVILAALRQRLADCDNVDWICPAHPQRLVLEGDGAALTLADGRILAASLVVGADGADSWVRSQAGIAVRGWAYDQKAVVATVKPVRHHADTAWQRFLQTGPLAFLPLPDGYCSIVWSTTPSEAERLLDLDDEAFYLELAAAFDERLGAIVDSSARAAFPLRLQHATAYTLPHVALIGDAAHTVHPLAGQGVNLGFLDAAALADVILEARRNGRAIGAHSTLRRYERWRKGDNLAMLAAMDAFKRLFGTRFAPIRWARNLGLDLTDRVGPAKNLLMEYAMGRRGDLPPLARGIG